MKLYVFFHPNFLTIPFRPEYRADGLTQLVHNNNYEPVPYSEHRSI